MSSLPTHLCYGGSMAPLFRTGDSLSVEAAALAQIRPGDVVVFRAPQETKDEAETASALVPPAPATAHWPPSAAAGTRRVVHRVVALREGGLVTRGDANAQPDKGLVTADRLEGRVVARERGGRVRRVHGGRRGLALAALAHLRLRALRPLRRLAALPYALLRRSGLVRHLWHPALRTLRLSTPQGPLVKTLHGRRTVARWWPQSRRFECRKPYDLILRLPEKRDARGDEANSDEARGD